MATISVCMIVRNEEKVLARCLDSLQGLWEELIIVDTGSNDNTKKIAARYTDKIYDFTWTGSFSDARNFSFSKAGCDYIYSADADEELDEQNRERFRILKEALMPEIEIVQMYYGNQLSQHSIYNYDMEYRPKLYKRLREFVWQEPIHEAVRLSPLVYDSDIVIWHKPEGQHGTRDLEAFEKMLEEGQQLSDRIRDIYLRELYFMGEKKHLEKARDYLELLLTEVSSEEDTFQRVVVLLFLLAKMEKREKDLLKFGMKAAMSKGSSEICLEFGKYFFEKEDYEEAALWFYHGAFETEPVLSLAAGEKEPITYLVQCYELLGLEELAEEYRQRL
ncbi:MAG: glycosyltransferase family 2 protein [Lachnospiraceae bacterium]|nr:glycosyltransferase family 2 protein [Lachnospiraceae bacterium]